MKRAVVVSIGPDHKRFRAPERPLHIPDDQSLQKIGIATLNSLDSDTPLGPIPYVLGASWRKTEREKTQVIIQKHLRAVEPVLPVSPTKGFICLLPLLVLARIFTWVFVPHPHHPLLLPQDKNVRRHIKTWEHYSASLPALRTCATFHSVGARVLYGKNTFTSPAALCDFDLTLSRTKRFYQQDITRVALQIDWADRIWFDFPPIAAALRSLKRLESLEIKFVSTTPYKAGRYLPHPSDDRHPGRALLRSTAAEMENRSGSTAEAMLAIEKDLLKQLVWSSRSLRNFRLVNFADEDFARELECYGLLWERKASE